MKHGFSLVETTVATILVGTLLVTSLHTVAFVTRASDRQMDTSTAALISQELMMEFSCQPFRDPTIHSDAIGREVGETERDLFDDFDDYDGWHTSEISRYGGPPLAVAKGWSAAAKVVFVDEKSLQISVAPTGLKRLTLFLKSPSGIAISSCCLRGERGVSMESLSGTSLSGVEVTYFGEQTSGAMLVRCINHPEVP